MPVHARLRLPMVSVVGSIKPILDGGKMIDVYSWATPNGHKVHIMLEETGLPYRAHAVNIRAGDQFKPEFLKISPNNRIPAIVDHEGPNGKPISLFESGAILIYLAGKTGKFLPLDLHARYAALQWLMWQMGGIGPMFGQANHFRAYAVEKIPYAVERYTNEANRLTNILDKRLGEARYLAGDDYSIADMAVFPWMRSADKRGINMAEYPHAKRWFDAINARPAVQRALQVLSAEYVNAPHDEKSRDIMFGKTQFQRR
jgi:GST-like protein